MTLHRPLPTAAAAAALVVGLTACSGSTTPSASSSPAAATAATTEQSEPHDTTDALTWDTAAETAVVLDGDTAQVDGDSVEVDGSTVTVTAPGTYRLSGSLTDGQVVVDSATDGVVRLVLDSVDLASSTSAPLVVTEADEVVVVLPEGSSSTLTDAVTYVYSDAETDEPNAALFSTANLTIGGDGALTVTGRSNDAIAAKDGLVILGGTITVDALDDGIRGKDYLVVAGGTLAVTAGGDGLKADNADDAALGYVRLTGGTLDVTAGVDGIDAATDVTVTGGELTVAADDDGIHADVELAISAGSVAVTRSSEGLEAARMAISGGDISVVASDDGVNVAGGTTDEATDPTADAAADPDADPDAPAAGEMPEGAPTDMPTGGTRPARPEGAPDGTMPERGMDGGPGGGGDSAVGDYHLTISGGTLLIDAGGDGLDSNGTIDMTGGSVVVQGPTNNGNGAIDVNGTFTISGGTLVAVGSASMAEKPDDTSTQGVVAFALDTQPAGSVVTVVDADGEEVVTLEAAKEIGSVVVSSPEVTAGEDYTASIDGSEVGTTTASGS